MDHGDELYGLPPEDFVGARDALAKQLKADGDPEAAAEVKALRRPSAVAWAINQAARAQPDALRELLAAGATLRRTHDKLLSGRATRDALREAAEAERAAVAAFGAATAEAAQSARRPLAPGALDKVRETLRAAALDAGVREALEAGRLEREASAVTAGALLATGASRGARGSGARAGRGPRGTARTGRVARASAARSADARELRAAREAAEAALRDADRAVRVAEKEAELRARKAELADDAARSARERLDAAEAELASAQAELEDGRRALREAKGAAAAAQAGLDDARERR